MINTQITTLIQDEGTAMKDHIHESSSFSTSFSTSLHHENVTDMNANRSDSNETRFVDEFHGIQNAEWCVDPKYDPLPYEECKFDGLMFRFVLIGGLTDSLNLILKAAIWAHQENKCYFLDERISDLGKRDPPQENIVPFIERYFEPLSLPLHHPKVQEALQTNKYINPNPRQIHVFGKFYDGLAPLDDPIRHQNRTIESLAVYDKDNIWMKKWMLRRMFRIKKHVQSAACSTLNDMGLNEEYMALSIHTTGDKNLEFEIGKSLQPYIDRAEIAIQKKFDGNVPKIYVASDNCSVMSEIRQIRPTWEFVGPCDDESEENGFVLANMTQWTIEQTDKHYTRFITEMIAMASAKHFIGVSTTNVAIWVYFMRRMDAKDDTWEFVDSERYPL